MSSVSHAHGLLRLRFDEAGLVVRPWPARPLRIGWDEIDFVCPVPWIERTASGWQEKRYPFAPKFRSTLQRSGRFVLYFVVRDRRPILKRAEGWWTRQWATLLLAPMVDASERRQEDRSLLALELDVRRLGGSLDPLLDLLNRHSRFDLVVFFD
jgi:hypothetical protein